MIHPSYTELINAINERDGSEEDLIQSRFSVVVASAKRARQLVADDEPLVEITDLEENPLSIAVEEIYKGKVNIILPDTEEEEEFFVDEDVEAEIIEE